MNAEITGIRKQIVNKILAKQDDSFRWGFDERQARERPEYVYYSPNFYKSDFLEILWLLKREKVHDRKMTRALDLLRSKKKDAGQWELEKSMNIIVSIGQKDCTNVFITERATEVLDYYGLD
ncbi:hypothetical protein EH223_13675 [candidate division KSB1 bacterium]|nr:hypothetical protein [candidate division KSB1 bacterium]RQW01943.1 MAG: hypothetical protein EH223_13675 [candidate division KSB1 bacterium]